jgi:hypothetical protein
MCVVAAAGVLALGISTAAWGAKGGNSGSSGGSDPNAGDVWVDNVGQLSGPGHEMDPHLLCQDINLWGSGMADSTGTFTISGWPPSGSKEQDYPATGTAPWTFSGTSTPMAVISVTTLIANAQANHDAPVNKQGYHFKLQLTQDPHKYKTFWVNCPKPPSGPTTQPCPSNQSTNSTGPANKSKSHGRHKGLAKGKGKSKTHGKHKGISNQSSSSPSTTNTCSSPPPTTSSTSPTSSTAPTTGATAPTTGVHKKKLRRPKRHKKAKKRAVSGASATSPAFTG